MPRRPSGRSRARQGGDDGLSGPKTTLVLSVRLGGVVGFIFLSTGDLLDIHTRAIAEHGGAEGLRDVGALESATMAPENRQWYEGADLAICAATYAFHLTQAHAFVDGNKRTAAAATEVFIVANGGVLEATDDELFDLYLAIASGRKSRPEVEAFMQNHVEAGASREGVDT